MQKQEAIEQDELFEQIENLNEGWAIYWAMFTENDGWKIERNDEDEVFDNDKQAIKHVYKMALQGSKVHADALEFMRTNASAVENLYITECILKN